MANKKVVVNGVEYANLGVYFETEECINKYFRGKYVKASRSDDIDKGIDGYLDGVAVQVKISVHSDGGASKNHGYSIVHKTSQRKLRNVKYLIFCLPEVLAYDPHYKLNHKVNIIYKIDRRAALDRLLFKYNKKGEIYLDKEKRKILDNMVDDKKAELIDIFIIP